LVDFLATERPVQFADLAARTPSMPSVTRVRARTTTTSRYPFPSTATAALALEIRAPKGDRDASAVAYVPLDSRLRAELDAVLFANDFRDVTIAVSFPTRNPEAALVEKYFGVDFFETPAERAFAFGKDGGP
jgi:hypothetical protein